jgi:predicted N-formylglutamate amidohydrolase
VPADATDDRGYRLLEPGDPPPVEVLRAHGASPILLTCEHSGRRFPARLGTLGLGARDLERHIAWDIGAAGVARRLSERLDAALVLQA